MKVVREDVKALKEEGTQNTESILHMSRTVLALKEEGTNNTESIIEMSNSIINTINNPRPARTTEAINRSLVENAEELLKIDLDINYVSPNTNPIPNPNTNHNHNTNHNPNPNPNPLTINYCFLILFFQKIRIMELKNNI